jgi:hypothetical protein
VWAIAQDHVNGDLLFAGTEFGLFTSVDSGSHWVQLKGGLPVAQIRDLAVQRREHDLVIATFGRGFYVLDDYTPLREMSAQALTEDAHVFALRDAYLFNPTGQQPAGAAGIGAMAGNWTAPNPPFGAVLTFNLRQDPPGDAKLVMTITDDSGKQVRRFDVDKGRDCGAWRGICARIRPCRSEGQEGQERREGQEGKTRRRRAEDAEVRRKARSLRRAGITRSWDDRAAPR